MARGPRFGFYYAIASIPLMGAGIFGPDALHLSGEAKTVAFIVCVALALACLLIGAYKELHAEATSTAARGYRRKLIAIAGMLVSGFALVVFAAAYFLPTSPGSIPGAAIQRELAKEINIYWVPPRGPDAPVVMCEFTMLSYGDRLRVFVDYALSQRGQAVSTEPRFMLADRRDFYPRQKLVVTILRLGEFGANESRHKELHWGEMEPINKTPPFMADFDYRSELVFVGPGGEEQHYRFRLVHPGDINIESEIKVYQGANY